LTVVVDQTRGPSDALLFGTTLAQSLGSVNLPNWKPGTMLTVRLLTLGANGNVVADAVFDPPAGTAALERAGTQPITVTETTVPALTGSESGIVLSSPASVTRGVGLELAVWAEDGFGNVNAGYRGTVHLGGTDVTGGTQNFTFGNNDSGVPIFSDTFDTPGLQTITVTDTSDSSISDSITIDVLAPSGGAGGGGGAA
jgi:hypothetical protein